MLGVEDVSVGKQGMLQEGRAHLGSSGVGQRSIKFVMSSCFT